MRRLLIKALIRPPLTHARAILQRASIALTRLGGVLLLSALCACTKTVDLESGLNDADANEIVALLNRHGIQAQKRPTKEGVALAVKDTEISTATEAMHAAGLPRRTLSDLGKMFKKDGMISTPLEERIRYISGLSAELEYTLQHFDHVIEARVHVVLPERIAPGEPIQPSSAAVFVKYRPPLDEDTIIPRIRSLVAASIPGLASDNGRNKVSVVLAASELAAPEVEWTTVGPFRVLADSANALSNTLTALVMLTIVSVLLAGAMVALRNPKIAALVNERLSKIRPRAAKSAAAANEGSSGDEMPRLSR